MSENGTQVFSFVPLFLALELQLYFEILQVGGRHVR